jgi:hypothetical protein
VSPSADYDDDILTEPVCAGVPALNTARIHVDAAVDWLLGGE